METCWNHFFCFNPPPTKKNLRQHDPVLCAFDDPDNLPQEAHTREGLWFSPGTAASQWWASPPLAILLLWLTSWPRLLFRKESLIPACFPTGFSACSTVERCRALSFVASQGISEAVLLTTLLAAALLPLPSSRCSGVLLSSPAHTARQAISLQRASILSVSVGWLHSKTWVDWYKRASLGTECWQRDGINTEPFASDHQGRVIGACPSMDDLLILSVCKCFAIREPCVSVL